MKLWGGRFTKETNQLVHNFNASISYDQKFYKQDILGSIAHVTMLEKQGILTASEKDAIVDGLQGILNDLESGALEITAEHEDIHSFVEANLIERIGDPGKKLHTGRSRNDQVALDMKLYTRDEIVEINDLLKELMVVIHRIMSENIDTFMPGFTRLALCTCVTMAIWMRKLLRFRTTTQHTITIQTLSSCRSTSLKRFSTSSRYTKIWRIRKQTSRTLAVRQKRLRSLKNVLPITRKNTAIKSNETMKWFIM